MAYRTTFYAAVTLSMFSSIAYPADPSTHTVVSGFNPHCTERKTYEMQKKKAERAARKQPSPQKLARAAANKIKKASKL